LNKLGQLSKISLKRVKTTHFGFMTCRAQNKELIFGDTCFPE
jgi:hypothetical protein